MLQSCCGSVTLKTGSVIIALISLAKQFFVFGAIGFGIAMAINIINNKADIKPRFEPDTEEILPLIFLILLVPHFVSIFLLILGILKETGWLMLPWLVVSAMMLLDVMFHY
ncbi:uncharacterized protein isoform X2 [Choristoneura fumiferana]|uniref:uncharacterized protein isoform X2 n=1 Tax=Choristoneura fumiferana TaxID=7141 RepID=UPI003D15BF1B